MWQVLPGFAKAARELVKQFGGGTKGIEQAVKHSPQMFKKTGKRTTKKIPTKPSPAPKTGKSGFTEAQLAKYRAAYKDPKAWAKVPPAIKKKLLA